MELKWLEIGLEGEMEGEDAIGDLTAEVIFQFARYPFGRGKRTKSVCYDIEEPENQSNG